MDWMSLGSEQKGRNRTPFENWSMTTSYVGPRLLWHQEGHSFPSRQLTGVLVIGHTEQDFTACASSARKIEQYLLLSTSTVLWTWDDCWQG